MANVYEVGGKSLTAAKTGFDQAEQVVAIGKWIQKHGYPVLVNLADENGQVSADNPIQLIFKIVDNVSPDALVGLFAAVLGTSEKFAREHFDIGILVDAVIEVFEQPAIKRVVNRFFSSLSLPDSSTESFTKSG